MITIKASLMLEDTLKTPLIQHDVILTEDDLRKGLEHIYAKSQQQILDRLTVSIDERELRGHLKADRD